MDQAEPDEGPGPRPPRPQIDEPGTLGHLDGDAEEESLMAGLEDLPAPDAESPESLIGSTAATRDAVTAETHDDARVQSHRVDIEMGSSAADTE